MCLREKDGEERTGEMQTGSGKGRAGEWGPQEGDDGEVRASNCDSDRLQRGPSRRAF